MTARLAQMIDTNEAARLLKSNVLTIHRLAREGYLPHIRAGVGRRYYFRRCVIELFAAHRDELPFLV